MLTLKTINREVAKPLGVNLVKTDDGFALIGTVVDCLQDKDIQVESLNDKPQPIVSQNWKNFAVNSFATAVWRSKQSNLDSVSSITLPVTS